MFIWNERLVAMSIEQAVTMSKQFSFELDRYKLPAAAKRHETTVKGPQTRENTHELGNGAAATCPLAPYTAHCDLQITHLILSRCATALTAIILVNKAAQQYISNCHCLINYFIFRQETYLRYKTVKTSCWKVFNFISSQLLWVYILNIIVSIYTWLT